MSSRMRFKILAATAALMAMAAPAVAPAPARLAFGAEPRAFGSAFARQSGEIVVGRAGLGDRADQNKEDAASSVAWWSGRIAR